MITESDWLLGTENSAEMAEFEMEFKNKNNNNNNNSNNVIDQNEKYGKQKERERSQCDAARQGDYLEDSKRPHMGNVIQGLFGTMTNFGNHLTRRPLNISELIAQGEHKASNDKLHSSRLCENVPEKRPQLLRCNSAPNIDELEEKKSELKFYLGSEKMTGDPPKPATDSALLKRKRNRPLKFRKRRKTTQLVELMISQPWRRLVEKHGECNVHYTNIKKRKMYFLLDMFTTVIEIRWRYILLLFFASFNVTWVLFAFVWWIISHVHKDHLISDGSSNSTLVPCVDGVTDFVTAFLFSLETMHTIGYGTRAMTDECPIAVFILILQACFGVFMQSIMTGVVLAKIARPKWRGHTIMFSKYAVINRTVKNKLCLKFRVADMRNKSHLILTSIRAIVVEKNYNNDGEAMPLNQQNFAIVPETGSDVLLMTWPVTILHYIDENSYLYNMTPDEMFGAKFEIIVILEGTIEPTGMSAQVRTSYIPSEIIWGERLVPLISYNKAGRYMIDHSKFHDTEEIHGSSSGLDFDATSEEDDISC